MVFGRDSQQRRLTRIADGACGRDNLNENKQWLGRTEVYKDRVRQIPVRLDPRADCLRQFIISGNDLMPAFTQPNPAEAAAEASGTFVPV